MCAIYTLAHTHTYLHICIRCVCYVLFRICVLFSAGIRGTDSKLICIHTHTHIHIYVNTHIYKIDMYTHTHTHIYVHTHTHICDAMISRNKGHGLRIDHILLHPTVYTYICMYRHMYVFICMYIYLRAYTYTHSPPPYDIHIYTGGDYCRVDPMYMYIPYVYVYILFVCVYKGGCIPKRGRRVVEVSCTLRYTHIYVCIGMCMCVYVHVF